jgi:hypothetical protein
MLIVVALYVVEVSIIFRHFHYTIQLRLGEEITFIFCLFQAFIIKCMTENKVLLLT